MLFKVKYLNTLIYNTINEAMFDSRFRPLPSSLTLPNGAADSAIGLPAGRNELRRRGARLHTSGSYGLTGRSPHRPQDRTMQSQVALRMTRIQVQSGIGSVSKIPQAVVRCAGRCARRGGRLA